MSTFLPICVNIESKRILLIGGGEVAKHKVKALIRYTQDITIVAPYIDPYLKKQGFVCLEKKYDSKDLDGYFLIYACTNIKELNRTILEDAHKKLLWVNVVDTPTLCDFVSPAIYKNNNMSVAVSSNGEDVYKSIEWRDRVKKVFEAHDTVN